MRHFVLLLLTISAFLAICLQQDCRAQGQGSASFWEDRESIVVLREGISSIELAPGEVLVLAGTEYCSSPKLNMSEWKGGIRNCIILKGHEYKDDKWKVWRLMGISAYYEGPAEVTLAPKDGGTKRTIKITVKKHPKDWKEKLQSALKDTKVTVEFKKASLEEVAAVLSEKTKMRFDSDYFVKRAKNKIITYSCKEEAVHKVLDYCLTLAGFDWMLKNNRVFLTVTAAKACMRLLPCVKESLRWLHFHQSKNGSFCSAKFTDNCRGESKCTGPGDAGRDVATSGLSLLAFLGDGHTHRVGKFKRTVRKAKEFLIIGQQNDDGSFGELKGELPMLDMFLGTMSLAEMYAVTRDATLKQPCLKAINLLLKAQHKDGGWAWEKGGGKSNTLATAFAVFALKAAKTAGLEFSQAGFDNAVKFFKSVTDEKGRAGYEKKGDKKTVFGEDVKLPACTAAAVIASIFSRVSRREDRIMKGVDLLLENLPDSEKVDPVYWYFATYALFQYGGKRWKKWYPKMVDVLAASQDMEGCASGSWKPQGAWARFGGRMFFTVLGILTSEIFLRYGRAYDAYKDSSNEK
jgi:hypothetical protein